MPSKRAVTFRNVALDESDLAAESDWRDSTAEERLNAVEAIRKATIELYCLDVPEGLARVLVAVNFQPREVRDRGRSRVRSPRKAANDGRPRRVRRSKSVER